ncbi:MAG TPA: DinB family protein [Thermoanaerobaculia bacterium]|nr:DinB family protein [Thermoanaerobaculia bacterium]
MQEIAEELEALLARSLEPLAELGEATVGVRPAPGKWSKKEILGHLVDSAANHHQRFVRAQVDGELRFPGYRQDDWVRLGGYQGEPWTRLVALFRTYNEHLAHLLSQIPEEKRDTLCFVGEGEPVTLGYLAQEYIEHLLHHLRQILGEEV